MERKKKSKAGSARSSKRLVSSLVHFMLINLEVNLTKRLSLLPQPVGPHSNAFALMWENKEMMISVEMMSGKLCGKRSLLFI